MSNDSTIQRDIKKVDSICIRSSARKLTEQYIEFCLSSEPQRLPNISGFFRWLKLSAAARDHFISAHADEYQTVKMIFEDEALNSPLPPSIVSAYMKQCFSREDDAEERKTGEITLLFEHDIRRDGE